MGRGTTALQAYIMGRKVAASDTNPLCEQLLRPRLLPPSLAAIAERLDEMPLHGRLRTQVSQEDSRLEVFFHRDVLARLVALKAWFRKRRSTDKYDAVDDWIRMVALNRLSGHSSGFFSVRTLPPNQAVSLSSQRKINEKNSQTPPPRDLAALILKKSKSLLRAGIPQRQETEDAISLQTCSSYALSYVADSSIDLVVTSPPFLNTVDYAQDNWLRLWFMGIKANTISFDVCASLVAWREFIRKTFVEFARVVRLGGRVAFEVGEVRNGTILLEEEVRHCLTGLPFSEDTTFINRQDFTKTSNCWGVANNKRGTNSNRVVVLARV